MDLSKNDKITSLEKENEYLKNKLKQKELELEGKAKVISSLEEKISNLQLENNRFKNQRGNDFAQFYLDLML